MTPEIVLYAILGIIFAIIAFDVYLALDKTKGNTISAVIRNTGKKWIPLIILESVGVGLLLGHWFW